MLISGILNLQDRTAEADSIAEIDGAFIFISRLTRKSIMHFQLPNACAFPKSVAQGIYAPAVGDGVHSAQGKLADTLAKPYHRLRATCAMVALEIRRALPCQFA